MFLDLYRIYSPTFCAEFDPDATYDDSTNHAIEPWEKLIYTHKAAQSKKMFRTIFLLHCTHTYEGVDVPFGVFNL